MLPIKKQNQMKWNEDLIGKEIMKLAEQFDTPKMPTNREVLDMTGNHALSNAIQKNGGFSYWAERLGLEQKKCETAVGIKWEKQIANMLAEKGHKVELTSTKHPYDLLVDGCVKIDVKAANASIVRGSKIHAYRIAKRQQTCDFYVCCENDEKKDIYVIPANMTTGQVQIEMGNGRTKYDSYKNAFYLISEATRFYESLVF